MALLWSLWLLTSTIQLALASPIEPSFAQLDPRAASTDCDQFTTGRQTKYSLKCDEYTAKGYPKPIAGSEVHIYHYSDGWPGNGPSQVSQIIAALGKALPVYEKFADQFDVTVVLDNVLKDDGDTWFPAGEPCYIWISSTSAIKNTVAHEAYHCVEYSARKNVPWGNAFNGWWAEAIAQFYADLFYPDHADNSFARIYRPNEPMYMQTQYNGYEAAIFWDFLNGYGFSHSRINNIAFTEPDAQSYDDARSSMSSNPALTQAFPAFAQAFFDDTITFPDGSDVDPVNKLTPVKLEQFDIPDCGSKKMPVQAPSWTIKAFGLTFDQGQSLKMTWKGTQSGAKLVYRKATDGSSGEWTAITTSSPASFALTCEDDPLYLDFIFTCTSNVNTCSGNLNVEQTGLLECPGDTPSQSCSSSPPPSGDCPYGSWKLTADTYNDYIKESTPSGVTLSDVSTSGSATFTLDKNTKKVTLQFNSLTGSYTDTLDTDPDNVIEYDVAIDGGGTATAVFAADGQSFKLTSPTYTGKFSSQTSVAGGGTHGPSGDFEVGFGPDVSVFFACSDDGKDMSLNGQSGGAFFYNVGDFEPAS